MSELYTSIRHFKAALNGGEVPPMTPLTEAAAKVIDPKLCLGMGGLIEDENKGLLCPVRGCGEYTHHLGTHLTKKHAGIGGHIGFRAALGIPRAATLESGRARVARSKAAKVRMQRDNGARARRALAKGAEARCTDHARQKAVERYAETRISPMYDNIVGDCESQTIRKLELLTEKLGHEPSEREFLAEYGTGIRKRYRRIFGSWNTLKARCGHRLANRKWTEDEVVESYHDYHKAHGEFPSAGVAWSGGRMPLTPSGPVVLEVLGVKKYEAALDHIAWRLGLDADRKLRIA